MYYTTDENKHGLKHDPFKALAIPRPIGWISTTSKEGKHNLAPYSFFNAISDRPPMVMFCSAGHKDSLRNIDMVFRYGGEEFLVLLSNTSREAAQMVGERLRLAVLGLQHVEEGRALELSISLGCATLLAGESPDSLLRRADNALYVSKREGRNRLSMAG